jgi:chorismate mutase
LQELADALQELKNCIGKKPVNPDLSLWLGGVERLYKVSKIRGTEVSLMKKNKVQQYSRKIAAELQNRFPDLPLLIDPSHITGDREMILEVTQEA